MHLNALHRDRKNIYCECDAKWFLLIKDRLEILISTVYEEKTRRASSEKKT